MYQATEERKVATRKFDAVISKMFNFHSTKSVPIAELKSKIIK